MRNDHAFWEYSDRYPAEEELEAAMRRARRMRSEAAHEYLKRAANWVRWLFSTDAIKVTVPVRRAHPKPC